MHDHDCGSSPGEALPSLAGWVARSDQEVGASSFAAFAGEVLAGLPAEERAQALSLLAAASACLRTACHGG